MCVHLPVGLSTTLCSSRLLASVHHPGVLSRAGESLQNLAMVRLLGEQPEGGRLMNGSRAFSCSAALQRNSCLSKNQCFKSVVYLFVYALINLGASALSLRACRAPHPTVGRLVVLGFDNVALCFQRDPDGQWAGRPRVQYPEALETTAQPLCLRRAIGSYRFKLVLEQSWREPGKSFLTPLMFLSLGFVLFCFFL